MSFFSKILSSSAPAPAVAKTSAVAGNGGVDEAVVAAISAALKDARNDRMAISARFRNGSQKKFNPWNMKFFGLRKELGMRNPWLQGKKNYSAWARKKSK